MQCNQSCLCRKTSHEACTRVSNLASLHSAPIFISPLALLKITFCYIRRSQRVSSFLMRFSVPSVTRYDASPINHFYHFHAFEAQENSSTIFSFWLKTCKKDKFLIKLSEAKISHDNVQSFNKSSFIAQFMTCRNKMLPTLKSLNITKQVG